MTKIKMCGLTRKEDIETVNRLKPDFIGFVFARKSKRYVTADKAKELKGLLDPGIKAVGVFVNEDPETVAGLLNTDVIDMAQLHGNEDEEYIGMLRRLSGKPIIKAFQIKNVTALDEIENSSADWVLIDSGAGTGSTFDWKMIKDVKRPYSCGNRTGRSVCSGEYLTYRSGNRASHAG